jgi:hypothetical protein
VLLVL